MTDSLIELIEDKRQIDSAFSEMLFKVAFLNEQKIFEKDIKEGEKWFDVAIGDYRKVRYGEED